MNFKTKTFLSFILFALSMNDSTAGMATYNRWTISEINVCFAEKETDYRMDEMQGPKRDWKQKEKELLQSVLEEEYTVQRTGYTFVGFKDCQDTEKINVIVGVRKGLLAQSAIGMKGVATLGMSGGLSDRYSHAQGAVVLSPMGVSKTTITHEFGHILGLMHEHEHPESPTTSKSLCPYYLNSIGQQRNVIYTSFDKESVMNYCYIFGLKGRNAGLSEKDRELILDIFNEKHLFDSRR